MVAAPGLVRAVKTVENVGEVFLRDDAARVFHAEYRMSAGLREFFTRTCPPLPAYLTALSIRMAASRRSWTSSPSTRTSGTTSARRSTPFFKRDGLKGKQAVRHGVAERNAGEDGLLIAGVRPCQKQHVLYEPFHLNRLFARIEEPLSPIGQRLLSVRQQEVDIGQNDSQRRFQLVRGVRDKAALLRPGAFDRGV